MPLKTALMGISVIRRVGGLEVTRALEWRDTLVIRRVGGLEVRGHHRIVQFVVIRRVGGLEDHAASLR